MKEALYALTITFLSLVSCQSKTTEESTEPIRIIESPTLEDYEIELISQMIDDLVHPSPPIPLPPVIDSAETADERSENYKKLEKELQHRYDTTSFTFYLDDTLMIPKKRFRKLRVFSDSAYYGLNKILMSDTLVPRKIALEKIESSNYQLIKNHPKYFSSWGFEFMGKARFSRIIFSENYTRALFYFEFQCGGLCGSGHLILAEKKNGKWEVVRDEMLWVA